MAQFLGQHFLTNEAAVKKIIASLKLRPGETIVEIGPGTGALTKPLLAQCAKLGCTYIGIEKDSALAEVLAGEQATIIVGDALHELPKIAAKHPAYKLVGNIPYYITGYLLRTISELQQKPSLTILMIQREVAQRLCAEQDEMNLLSAATQLWAQPKILFTLPPTDFNPPPKVHSAVISLTPHSTQPGEREARQYYELLHIVFKQPRKTILNNLAAAYGREAAAEALNKATIDPGKRPQNLSVEQLLLLAQISAVMHKG